MDNINYPQLAEVVEQILRRKDPTDPLHSQKVSRICAKIGALMNRFTPHECEMLKWGSRLHDVGKIFLDDTLLNFPRKLTAREHAMMETHTVLGRDFVTAMGCDPIVVDIVHHHHCNEDGSGYPRSRSDPSIFARIVRVVDAYDAMTNNRVYQFPSSREDALALLEAETGTTFSAEVVLFLKLALVELDQDDEQEGKP